MKKLLERVNEIERIVRDAQDKGSLSILERDLLLEKLRQMYDSLLFDINGETEKVAPPVEELPQQEVVAEEEPEVTVEEDEVFDIEEEESVEEELEVVASEQEAEEEVEMEQEAVTEEKPQEVVVPSNGNKHTPAVPLGERYISQAKSRNELLAHGGKKDMATVFQNKPIEDLGKAIGINDKFLYTKELFEGNAELYANSIKQLNEFTDINDALIYIQDNFNWDNDNEAANQLIDLIRRKLLHS